MSKELEAFRDILGILSAVSGCEVDMNSERVRIVKSALQRLEVIEKGKNTDFIDNYMAFKNTEQTNPSEALEGLKHIKKYYVPQPCSAKTYDYLEIIEQTLLKAQEQEKEIDRLENQCLDVLADNIRLKNKSQEQEKVLSIIKEKGVDIATFNTYQSVIEYNWSIRFEKHKRKELTQEEFDLLKRYFNVNN